MSLAHQAGTRPALTNGLTKGSSGLSSKLMLLFLLLSIVPLVVVGYLAFETSRRTIEQDTVNRLLSITILKEEEMNRWIEDKEQSMRELAERRAIQEHTATLTAYEPTTPEHMAARTAICEEHFHPALEEEGFLELSLLRPSDGLILASTDERHEGQHRENESYFLEGKTHTYVQNVYYSLALEEAAMIVGTPVQDSDGHLIAVLAGRVDLIEISEIMTQRSSLSESENTYMVNEFNFLVTESRFEPGSALKTAIHTEGVADCLARKPLDMAQDGADEAPSDAADRRRSGAMSADARSMSAEWQHPYGVGLYADYRGVPVIGVYRWIPERELCILTEVDQSEAFAPIAALRSTITEIGAVVVLIVAILAVWFAGTITGPVHQLVKGAEEIGEGNLEYRIQAERRDEIGQLAQAFNRMAERLQATTTSRNKLNREITERIRIEETLRRSEREKAAILDSMSDLVVYHDTEMSILWANRAASESAGLTSEQLRGGHCYEIWHQRGSPCVGCPVVEARETGHSQETEMRTPDGRSWFIRGYPVIDTDGIVEGIVETTQDITEDKQVQESLRHRAREMELLQATVLDITRMHDLPTLLQTVVERAAHLLDAPSGGLYLCDPEQEQVRCVVSYNTPRDYTGITLKYGEGAAGTVAQTGEPLIIDDYRVWSRRAGVYEEEQPFTTVLSAPMLWQGQVTGVIIVLEEGERRHFTQADLELLALLANHAAIAVENTRLYEQAQAEIAQRKRAEADIARASEALRRRTAQLETLRQVSLELTAQLDLDALLHSIIIHAVELLNGTGSGIALHRPERDLLEAVVSVGDTSVPIGTTFRRGEGLAGTIWETGEPLAVDDYRRWEGRMPAHEGMPIIAVAGVPIRWGPADAGGGILGVLIIQDDAPRTFSASDVERLRLLATQAAIAIRNARLYEAEAKRAAQLAVVNRVARQAVSILDPDQLLQEIVAAIQQGFEYYNVALFLLDESAGELVMSGIAGGFEPVVPDYRQAVDIGMIGWTARTGQSLLSNDVSQESRYIPGFLHFLEEVSTQSELCVPLKLADYGCLTDVRGHTTAVHSEGGCQTSIRRSAGVPSRGRTVNVRVIGVLDVQETRLDAFDETDLLAMQTLADQMAAAIENARLFEEARKHVAELEALQRTSLQLASSLDPSSVLDTVVESALTLMEANDCHIYLYDESTETFSFGAALWEDGSREPAVQSPRPDGLTATVAREGRPIVIDDAHHHPLYTTPEAQSWGLHSIVGLPLKRADRVLGVLTVAFLNPHALDARSMSTRSGELRALGVLADQAAIAIENARLYEEAMQDAQTRAVLLREVNHRVKNNLTAIIGLLYAARAHASVNNQTAYETTMNELIGQVRGLATAHSMLFETEWTPVLLGDLTLRIINNVLRALPSDKRVTTDVPPSPVRVTPDEAHNLALVINELATNATKYALGERTTAHIVFRSVFESGTVQCEFRDDGPGYPDDVLAFQRHTVGLDLIRNIVRDSLNGKLSLHNDQGAVVSIQFEAQIGKGEENTQ